jgi:MFS family permease
MPEAPGGAPQPAPRGVGIWSPAYRLLTTGLLLLMTASAFENLAVATTLPVMVRELDGLTLYGWAFSVFTLANLLGITLAGSAADRRGPLHPLAAGIVVFTLGLVGGGLARTMPLLIASRAVQGLGSGLLTATIYVAIGRSYPESIRARMLASLSTAWIFPGLVGPAVAGLIAEHLGWRWVFLGLIPLPLLAVPLIWPALTPLQHGLLETTRSWRRLYDALQLTVGVGLLLTGLRATASWRTIGVGLLGAGFTLHALQRLTPPGTLRATTGLPATIATMGLLTLAFFGVDVFIPLALTTGRGQRTWVSGLAYAATSLGWAAGAWGTERLATRRNRRGLVLTGLLLLTLGMMLMITTTWSTVSAFLAIPSWGLAGVGMGLAYTTLSLTVLELAPAGQEGGATAAMQLAERIGTALGAGLGGVIIGAANSALTTLNTHIASQYLLMIMVVCLTGWTARRVPSRVAPT